MSIRQIFDWAAAQADGQMIGTIAGPFVQLQVDGANWLWAVDVDIGQPEVLRNVPVASNNHELIYAQQGMAVALSKMGDGRWCVTGLAKSSRGLGHVMYVAFTEDMATVVREEMTGHIIRPLTLGEMGTLGPASFGILPFGARGRFTPSGALIEILEN